MDLLMAEIARKRKSVERAKTSNKVFKTNSGKSNTTRKRQYFRASDLRRFEEEGDDDEKEERQHQSEKQAKQHKQQQIPEKSDAAANGLDEKLNLSEDDVTSTKSKSNTEHTSKNPDPDKTNLSLSSKLTNRNLTSEEITKKLRSIGQPIRLFGENLTEREARLFQAEQYIQKALSGKSDMDDFRLGSGHGIRNTFLQEDEETNQKNDSLEHSVKDSINNNANSNETVNNSDKNGQQEENEVDLSKDPHKHIYKFFRSHLKLWESDLLQRPDHIKRTAAGKNETKTLKQCRDYIRPLFKLCKSRKLEPFLLESVHKIVLHCLDGEFVLANNVYNDVAIGRAAWPIGVTMVGIHARSGRAKIESGNVAHVMNSELQRKYLTSVKRLMTYCQKTRKDVAPSKKVMN